jgi:hypothetical protein
VKWSADGRLIASGGVDQSICLWGASGQGEAVRLLGHEGEVTALAFRPDSARLASASRDGTVRIWDTESARLLAVFEAAGSDALARSPGGFCVFQGAGPFRLALRRPEPESRTVLFLPLAGLRDALHRPDKVAAALAGDLSGDDIAPELEGLGYSNGAPWDGETWHVPHDPSPRSRRRRRSSRP